MEEVLIWEDYEEAVKVGEAINPPDDFEQNQKVLQQFRFANSYTMTKNLGE